MQNENIEQLKKISKLLGADKVITASDIEQVLIGVMKVMSSFKKDNEKLTEETKDAVKSLYSQLATEHDKMVKELENTAENKNKELKTEFEVKASSLDKSIAQVKTLLKEIQAIEVKHGKDADEEMIIDSVLAKIKLPEYKETVLDDGEEIVAKINELSTTEDAFKIDASHIKNLPASRKGGYAPTVLGNAVDLNQSARADGYAIVWDDVNKNFKFSPSGGGAVTDLTGNPTEIPYFDAVGNGTSDADHTLLTDGTLNLESTFGDVTASFVQRVEPALGNTGIWGTTSTNNSTGATITQGIIDGTNILDLGSDSIFATIAEFPATNTAAQQFVGSAGIFQGVSVGSDVFIEENITSAGYELGVYDLATPAGSNIFAFPTGAGLLSRDLSSYPTGYDVYSLYGTVYVDDTGVTSRVQTGKDIVDYVQNGTTHSIPAFIGTGTDDLSIGGDYTGAYTGNYSITVIGNDGARVVFNGGMTTGDRFAVGEVVTGSISGATAVVSNGTGDTRIWVYDVTGTGFVNGDILTGDQGNVSTAVTTAGNAPGVGDLFEVNYTDIKNTNVQWLTGNQAFGTTFPGIGGITYEFTISPTGHTPNARWTFTASALYEERYKANETTVSTGDIADQTTKTKQVIDIPNQTISGWSDGANKNVLVGKELALPDNTIVSVFEVALPSGAMTGGFFTATIIATDGTDLQAHSDHVTYAAVNKAGTITATIQASNADDAVAVSAGTLTVTWTINTATAGKITIEVTANSSLAAPTITLAGLNIDNNNGHVVTIL